MNASEKMAKGILFESTVEFLKEKNGDEGVAALESTLGETLLFDPFILYPLEKLMKLQAEVLKKAFGKAGDAEYRSLGNFEYQGFASTLAGATLLNVGTSPKILLEKIQELWGTVVNFGERTIELVDEHNCKVTISISDDPREPAYLCGVIEAGLSSIGLQSVTTTIRPAVDTAYHIDVVWK